MQIRDFRKTKNSIRCCAVIMLLVAAGGCGMSAGAYEAAYPKTPVGAIEIKTVPGSKLMVTKTPGVYFDTSNRLFRRLFAYLKDNRVSMTVPVEADIDSAGMKFYIGSADQEKNLQDSGQVRIVEVPGRTVASIGLRGRYTRERYEKGRVRLVAWLSDNPRYQAAGDAYAVYWDSPFTLWFLKRSEVHIPVAEQEAAGAK